MFAFKCDSCDKRAMVFMFDQAGDQSSLACMECAAIRFAQICQAVVGTDDKFVVGIVDADSVLDKTGILEAYRDN